MVGYIPTQYGLFTPNAEYLGMCYVIYRTLVVDVAWNPHGTRLYDLHLKNSLNSLKITEEFDHVLACCVLEEHVTQETVTKISEIVSSVFSDTLALTIYNTCREYRNGSAHGDDSESLGINHFGIITSYTADPNFLWNPKHNRSLWLMGKPTKYDRLALLYHLIESGVSPKYLTYSFNPEYCPFDLDPYSEGQRTLDTIWHDTNPGKVNYREWAARHASEIGDIELSREQYHGALYDLNIYKSHCCEIVTETFFDQPHHLTEKVHRSIALGFPFLMLGDHMEDYMRTLGYQMYSDLVLLPRLDPSDPRYLQLSCEKMAKQIIQFCESCKDAQFQHRVRDIINHNKSILENQIAKTVDQGSRCIPHFSSILNYKCQLHIGKHPLVS